jgi:hypothetical protein
LSHTHWVARTKCPGRRRDKRVSPEVEMSALDTFMKRAYRECGMSRFFPDDHWVATLRKPRKSNSATSAPRSTP